jgi:hypothetical protein
MRSANRQANGQLIRRYVANGPHCGTILIVRQRNVAREPNLTKPQRVKTGQVDQRAVAPALCGRGRAVLGRRPSMIRPLVPANSSDRRDHLRWAAE